MKCQCWKWEDSKDKKFVREMLSIPPLCGFFLFAPELSRTQYTFQRDERVWHYSYVVFVTMTTSPLHENERIIFAKEINVFFHVRSRARWVYCEFQNTYANTSASLQNIICQKCPCDLRTMYEQWNDPMGFLQKVYSVASTYLVWSIKIWNRFDNFEFLLF